ncbi:hypothetical protein BH09PSE5_BH09PSE5_12640 [soil metagenome]
MDRLLSLRLRSIGCAAQALVNGVPVASIAADGASTCVPVHEYLVEGKNQVELVIDPPGAASVTAPSVSVAATAMGASLRLLLPRIGMPVSEASARSLVELDWTCAEGDIHEPPIRVHRAVELPINFPRWRWLEVPPRDDLAAIQPLVAEFVQEMAGALIRGNSDPFVASARVRFEDVALAYQQPMADLVSRWHSRIQLLHVTGGLRMVMPAAVDVVLRSCAGGRLFECLGRDGRPALRTEARGDGAVHSWPIRVAVVGGRCHVMR